MSHQYCYSQWHYFHSCRLDPYIHPHLNKIIFRWTVLLANLSRITLGPFGVVSENLELVVKLLSEFNGIPSKILRFPDWVISAQLYIQRSSYSQKGILGPCGTVCDQFYNYQKVLRNVPCFPDSVILGEVLLPYPSN